MTEALPISPATGSSPEPSAAGPGTSGFATRAAPEPSGGRAVAGQAFTTLSKIEPGHEQDLADYLTGLGRSIDESPDIAFARLRLVHFMRWVVVKDAAGLPWLALETNHDGDIDAHIGELLEHGAGAIHAIYRHCVGYPFARSGTIGPADRATFASYLRERSLKSEAFHVGVHGKTAERIRREAAIRDAVEVYLDQRRPTLGSTPFDPDALHRQILEHLDGQGLLESALEVQPPRPESRNAPWILRALPVVLPLVPFLPLLYPLLRIHEAKDGEDDPVPETPGIRELADREDFQVQNQLTHVVNVKPGPFRRLTLKLVLFAIDLLARFKFNQGALGGITTIHFARWVTFDEGRRLLFLSNFDGSWESYLGDFIDKAHIGLTGVWSNAVGFPRTSNLVNDGATDEERFKSWTRAHQVPTQLWYTAYPELTVRNIQRNAEICAGLAQKPATREAMLAWLERL